MSHHFNTAASIEIVVHQTGPRGRAKLEKTKSDLEKAEPEYEFYIKEESGKKPR